MRATLIQRNEGGFDTTEYLEVWRNMFMTLLLQQCLMIYVDNTLHVNEFFHALNIGTPDFKASAGLKNDPRTHVWCQN